MVEPPVVLSVDDVQSRSSELTNGQDVQFNAVRVRSAIISVTKGRTKPACRDAVTNEVVSIFTFYCVISQRAKAEQSHSPHSITRVTTAMQGTCANCNKAEQVKISGYALIKITSSEHTEPQISIQLRAGCAETLLGLTMDEVYDMKASNARAFVDLQREQLSKVVNVTATVFKSAGDEPTGIRFQGINVCDVA